MTMYGKRHDERQRPPKWRITTHSSKPKKFDLNIERVLEGWGVHHALREIIANALDEQALTDTDNVEIAKDKTGRWHIRDYGRGLKHEHLTQNENKEKQRHPDKVIGKFGVGLKDALATFDRHNIKVWVRSRYGDITLGKAAKRDFADITTLHALIAPPSDDQFVGTDVVLTGVRDQDIALAKELFLKFANDKVLEETQYGQVLDRGKNKARIYINGLRVAEEDNFLCSFNITAVTKAIRDALNRERSNVGRTAYTERVKQILRACTTSGVALLLVKDLQEFATGCLHDELQWLDTAVHACKLLNAIEPVVFVTHSELIAAKTMVEYAQQDRYRLITVPDTVKQKLRGQKDYQGKPIRDLVMYAQEWDRSFKFHFVKEQDLTKQEREVFNKTAALFTLIGGKPKNIQHVRISTTMRVETYRYQEAAGVWDRKTASIIIKRDQLKGLQAYAGTLLHETAHVRSNAGDITADFELELTRMLGIIAAKRTAD